MSKEVKNKAERRYGLLLFFCWLVYACTYLGKVNYSANITQIETYFSVSHAETGLVGTFFFFAYGAGQIFNGIFCKKYNIKYVIFFGLLISALANFGIAVCKDFSIIKFLWLINGFCLSVFWPTLIRLLSETLPKKYMMRASMVMGTTVASGTLVIYGLSALYVKFGAFKLAFFTPAVVFPVIGILWLILFNGLTTPTETDEEEEPSQTIVNGSQTQKVESRERGLLFMIITLAVFAVATNLVQDGLTTWVPSILKEEYNLPDSLSILLTLVLPLLAIFANMFAVFLQKHVKNFVISCGIVFFLGGGLILGVIGLLRTDLFVLTLILFGGVRFMSGASNSTITSVFPLTMKGKVNSGLLAGVLNGCCYMGSTISSYGLGVIADHWGWTSVFGLLGGICAFVVVASIIVSLILRSLKKGEK